MTTKKQNKQLVKRDDKKNKMKKIIKPLIESFDFSDTKMIEEYAELEEKNKLTSKEEKKRSELQLEIIMMYGLKNGAWVANITYGKYQKALTTIRTSLVREYNCTAPLELMLIDRIVASYWRAMKSETVFNHLIEKEGGGFSFDQLKVNIIKEINKSIELANRHLNANIILLKELKQPKLNVKVNTKNAFVAQNQQFNTNKKNS